MGFLDKIAERKKLKKREIYERNKLAVLRLDGDMYGSTMTVLEQLYHKLEIGGYLILDDWLISGARQALLVFRERLGIKEALYEDFSGVFWKKTMATDARLANNQSSVTMVPGCQIQQITYCQT